MSMLTFFPWLKIREDIKIGDIKLHKFKLSEENTNKDRFQNTCEKVVKHYYIRLSACLGNDFSPHNFCP